MVIALRLPKLGSVGQCWFDSSYRIQIMRTEPQLARRWWSIMAPVKKGGSIPYVRDFKEDAMSSLNARGQNE